MKQLIPISNSQQELEKQLKIKDKEITKLKNQISINTYGMSQSSQSGIESVTSPSKIVYQEKDYKLSSKVKNTNKRKLSPKSE